MTPDLGQISIRRTLEADWPAIESLLLRNRLPLQGAREHQGRFHVAVSSSGTVVGVAGLEAHGRSALLRSVAVEASCRGAGLGERLVRAVMADAMASSLRLYLLTTEGSSYFARIGFVEVARERAPSELQASPQLAGACPASARLMILPAAALHRLRHVEPGDAEAICAIYGPVVEATVTSFELKAPTVEEMRSRIVAVGRPPWLVSLDGQGRVSGYTYAGPHRERPAYRWSVDTTVYVREDCRGQGMGRQLYTGLFAELVSAATSRPLRDPDSAAATAVRQ